MSGPNNDSFDVCVLSRYHPLQPLCGTPSVDFVFVRLIASVPFTANAHGDQRCQHCMYLQSLAALRSIRWHNATLSMERSGNRGRSWLLHLLPRPFTMKYSLPGVPVLSLTMKTAYFTPECPVCVFRWFVIYMKNCSLADKARLM